MQLIRQICLTIMVFILGGIAYAKTAAVPVHGKISQTLRVGIILEMPFAEEINGHYSGIAVDIWERIAKLNHWRFTYVPINENVDEELHKLADKGNLDIIIGGISIDADRLRIVDFTRPFYLSSIGIITQKHELGILDMAKVLFTRNLLHAVIILVLVFMAYLSLLWFMERNKVKQNVIPNGYYSSLTSRIWLYLFQKKVDYMPATAQGRIVGIFWVIFAAIIFALINASVTSAITMARYENTNKTSSLDGLQSARIAGVAGQLNVETAEKYGVNVKTVPSLAEAVKLLNENKVDGVVCDTPIGIAYLRLHGLNNLIMSSYYLENDEIAFAVRQNSPIRHAVDLGIVSFQDDDSVVPLCRKYIGDEAKRCDM